MNRELRWYDAISLSSYFFGQNFLMQVMTPLIIPLLVQQYVGNEQQATFFGQIRLWSLMAALLMQSLAGLLSDRSSLGWGRRRPFILAGTLISLAVLVAIGFTADVEGLVGYWLLFGLVILLQISANTSVGAAQGLIPDLVSSEQRGRFSAVKAILEVPLPVILVGLTAGPLIAAGQMWPAILVIMGALVLSLILSLLAPEKPLEGQPAVINWQPFLRLASMAGVFTLVLLGTREVVKLLINQVEIYTQTNFALVSATTITAALGEIGLGGMIVAIFAGVFLSMRVGLGREAKKHSSFIWWVASRLCFLAGVTNIASFAVFYLQGKLNLEKSAAAGPASQIFILLGVVMLLLSLPAGWLADRIGRKPLLALAGLLAAGGAMVIVNAQQVALIYVGAALVGAATGLFYAANWALGIDLAPKDRAGMFLGIANLAGAGAGAVGAYLGGPVADYMTGKLTSLPSLAYEVLFGIYAALFLASVIALIKVELPGKTVEISTSSGSRPKRRSKPA